MKIILLQKGFFYFSLVISKKAKYAINALTYLARRKEEGPVLISTISEEQNIPRKFLEAILLELKNEGYLDSKKGRGGGYFLVKDYDQVNMAEVMRLFDGPIALLPCVTYKYYERCEECEDEKTCGIRDVVLELRNQTVSMLKEASLEKILKREKALKK